MREDSAHWFNICFQHNNMTTRTERFQRKPREAQVTKDETEEEPEEVVKFSPEEEVVCVGKHKPYICKDSSDRYKTQSLLNESNTEKASANALFAKTEFKEAINSYDKALSICPNYLYYEIAVLKSNIAACHLKLEDWKEAVKAASAALDSLDKLQDKNGDAEKEDKISGDEEEADEEIITEGATKAEDISSKGQREADIERIRAKALMRRARARSEQGGWATLQGAEEGMLVFGYRLLRGLII